MHEIEIVYRLVRDKGLTLEGARQVLKTNKTEEDRRVEVLDRLKKVKKELLSLEEEFNILHKLQKYTKTEKEK